MYNILKNKIYSHFYSTFVKESYLKVSEVPNKEEVYYKKKKKLLVVLVKDEEKILKEIEEKIEYPMIVKPGNLGSSVGIKKAKNKPELEEAIEFAMEFTDRVIVEKAVEDLKEM